MRIVSDAKSPYLRHALRHLCSGSYERQWGILAVNLTNRTSDEWGMMTHEEAVLSLIKELSLHGTRDALLAVRSLDELRHLEGWVGVVGNTRYEIFEYE